MMGAARLVVERISKRYGATIAAEGVSLAVRGGEVLALVGENGAGKSTLMRVMAGAERPDAGTMKLDGVGFAPASPAEARARGIAMIHQELAIAPHLSAAANVMLGVERSVAGFLRGREMERRARRAMDAVGLAVVPTRTTAGRLTVAQRQLLEVARAIAVDSGVVILDEPTSGLGREDARRLFGLIGRLKAEGRAVIFVSHAMEEILAVADRYAVLRDGRITGEGPIAGQTAGGLVDLMAGGEVGAFSRRRGEPGEVVLDIASLRGARLPTRASLSVRRGEVVGIAGLMGAGRTELLRAVFGLDAVREGRVTVKGYSGTASPRERWAGGAGMVSEDRKGEGLALGMSIADNTLLPALPMRPSTARRRAADSAVDLARVGVRMRSALQRVGELSGGNQQKVAIARLLHARCDVLLLDEPTRGIDAASRARLYAIIDGAARGEEGRPRAGVLIASSSIAELLGLCDRIAVMKRGELGPARDVRDWDEHSVLMAATGATA